MSWLLTLYDTYETCFGREPDGSLKLMPIAHTTQLAQIEIVLDEQGNFRRARVLDDKKERNTLVPCTEDSGGRSGIAPASHPLCDKLQYIAADFTAFGGEVTSGFAKDPEEPHRNYLKLLSNWAQSESGHIKLDAILRFVQRGQVVAELIADKVLPVDDKGRLLKVWEKAKEDAPTIFKALATGQMPEDAFVRWVVEGEDVAATVWEDKALIAAWVTHYASLQTERGYCMVSGQETTLASQHPAKLRNGGDKAKLISANDSNGFTYRGRFIEPSQAVGVGYVATQKAHNALRWLIERQGSRNGDQAVVSWTVSGKKVPNPMSNTVDQFGDDFGDDLILTDTSAGQIFALRLQKAVNGYLAKLDPSEDVHVIALDSATPGRMSIIFSRCLKNSEYLRRIEDWHLHFAWPQNFGKGSHFTGAPSPKDIAQAAYGRSLTPKLEAATRERLLPCIVDQLPLPLDLERSVYLRAVGRIGLDWWEWEKILGIACALFKGIHCERNYKMTLETDRKNRDYLYGRLLALAENIESYALWISDEKRETNAARMMHRFSQKPHSTWLILEAQQLAPYRARLRSRRSDFLFSREKMLDSVYDAFAHDDFVSDAPLSGEFLLGYHCQREALRKQGDKSDSEVSTETTESND